MVLFNFVELKPCPFCGCKVHWENYDGVVHDEYREECFVNSWPFNGEFDCYSQKERIIEAWNRRANE